MRPGPEKGEFLPAIIHYLKSIGVHVQHRKASPSQEKAVPASCKGVFGVPLQGLPRSERAEGVPQFLVDACELLRPHLHTEGLFRKCGSLTRIKALKTRLEAGENCLEMALPCDVATLVKQFLRDLPEPLIPVELQRPLCEVQRREDSDLRGPLTVLLTCLFPPGSAHTLRYLFTFLQEVTTRSAQNKMDLANLAVVFAPNLFPSELCGKLDSRAEEQLQRQAAVIRALIGHASEIGTVPQSLLEKVQAAFSDVESQRLSGSEDVRDREAEARRWRRRRSVGDIVTETLSKLKTGRAFCPAPCQETKEGVRREDSPSLRTSFNSKRKASGDDASWVPELSAKKRRSILDSFADAGEPFDQPKAEGLTSPVPAFSSSSPSNPVSDVGSQEASPRVQAVTVQRKRSSCRNRPQRTRSFRATPGCSPSPFQQKDPGRKSFRIFFRSSKYPVSSPEQSPPISDKAAEPSGWLLMKKTVMQALDGFPSQQKWAQLSSYKLKEGSPNPPSCENRCAPTCKDQEVPGTLGNCRQGDGLSPSLDGISCSHQEPDLGVLLGSQGLLHKPEGLVAKDRPPAPPLRRHRALRRSLSWPEDLSVRDAAEPKEMAFSPDEALIGPATQMFSLAEPAQPDVDLIVAGMRQLGIPEVCATPADNCGIDCPGGKPSPLPPKPEPPEARVTLVKRLCHLNEVPKASLKHFSLTFQRASPPANDGPDVARRSPPKRKSGRRFGRSVSHESSLPLKAQEETQAGSAAKRGAAGLPQKSPLQSFKACGQQIILTRKHIALSFAGLRRKKEVLPPGPPNLEPPAAVSQEPVLERPNRGSARFSRAEWQF